MGRTAVDAMTERLYYSDPYQTCFSAGVVEHLAWDGQPAVVLDRTAFYPEGGGQPADNGVLNGAVVADVVVREKDNAVVHVLDRGLPKEEVEGTVDWRRRFDHMQQHTGQHVLSAAFERVLDADTVGFHLGTDASTIDINVARLGVAQAHRVEDLANRVVWEDRSVRGRVLEVDQASELTLRRTPTVQGPVRIVEIVEFDLNPCGGTHVAHTGEIGLIKIVGLEYRRGQTRVEFVCGGRALRDYRAKDAVVAGLATKLTVGYWELEQALDRMQAEARELRHEVRDMRSRLTDMEAAQLADEVPAATAAVPYTLIGRVWEGRGPEELRALGLALAGRPRMAVMLAGVTDRTHLCFARGEEVDLDMAALLRGACAKLGGKGGGRPHLAQGSAPPVDVTRVRQVMLELETHLRAG
jgi:alanyl-tRNA synthetase